MSLPNSGRLLLPVLLGALPTLALAADAALTTAPVVVTATRVEQSGFDLPVSIDSLNKQQLQDGQLQVNLSESLARIPGIVAQNRQNYAQDLQISSRGFGARASFGVRGLRLYADGIPATMPDGQGQVSHIDLGSAARVEVMRGPFSALYGNSSGGVIAVFIEDGAPGMRIEPSLSVGSYGTERIATKLSGDTGTLNYVVNGARFSTDGYRDHSSATRQTLNAKLKWKPSADTGLTFTANSMEMPDLQDPLGLDRASYDANPRQATANAYLFDTRKSSSQQQLGLTLDQKVGADDTVSVMLYRSHRDTTQYQAIAVGAQVASHPGGVIDLKRDYWGIDARWTHRGRLAGGPLTVTGGISYDDLDEARKGFQNFIGAQTGGLGALRRNEDNRIHSFDQYLQAQWEPTPAWLLIAGARHSAVKVSSKDKYIAVGNLDDSGSVDYAATTPVVGVTWRLSPALNLYASAGRGFETPTMNELSYRAGASGPNFGLRPSRSDNLEIGVKALIGQGAQLNAAVFTVKTRDELVTLQNTGGRAVFQNVGGTRRNGLELSATAELGNHFQAAVAYSYLNAWYAEAFRSCTGTPCAVPNTAVAAGNLIPGIPRSSLFAELSWRHPASGIILAITTGRCSRLSREWPMYQVGRFLVVSWLWCACLAADSALAAMGDDPLQSPQWTDLKQRYLGAARVVFDPRVVVTGPKVAEDSMNVPVSVKISGLADVRRVLVVADLNPIVKVLEFSAQGALPALYFRMKLQQGSPVRAMAETADGVWHVGGIWIDASGGGCTAPSVGRGTANWHETLGQVQSRVWPGEQQSRVKINIMHPMDTGLAPGIPAFYIERLALQDATGREWMRIDTFEPVSENPVFSFDFPGTPPPGLSLVGRDNNGNRINARVVQ